MSKHIIWAIAAAVSFWVPVILAFAVERTNVSVVLANAVSMFGFFICWAIRRWVYTEGRQSIWMLLGLYFFGPTLLSTATAFANGGFAQIHGWMDIRWLLVASFFPPMQFLLAATSGLWPSLLVITLILIWASVTERRRAVIKAEQRRPPSVTSQPPRH
jgi:hypothetical protein